MGEIQHNGSEFDCDSLPCGQPPWTCDCWHFPANSKIMKEIQPLNLKVYYAFISVPYEMVMGLNTVTGDGSREPYNQALHEEMKPGSTRLT